MSDQPSPSSIPTTLQPQPQTPVSPLSQAQSALPQSQVPTQLQTSQSSSPPVMMQQSAFEGETSSELSPEIVQPPSRQYTYPMIYLDRPPGGQVQQQQQPTLQPLSYPHPHQLYPIHAPILPVVHQHYPVYKMNEYAGLHNLSIDQLRTYILCLLPEQHRTTYMVKNGNGIYIPNYRAFGTGTFINGSITDPQKIDYVILAGLVRDTFGERGLLKHISSIEARGVEEEGFVGGGGYGEGFEVRGGVGGGAGGKGIAEGVDITGQSYHQWPPVISYGQSVAPQPQHTMVFRDVIGRAEKTPLPTPVMQQQYLHPQRPSPPPQQQQTQQQQTQQQQTQQQQIQQQQIQQQQIQRQQQTQYPSLPQSASVFGLSPPTSPGDQATISRLQHQLIQMNVNLKQQLADPKTVIPGNETVLKQLQQFLNVQGQDETLLYPALVDEQVVNPQGVPISLQQQRQRQHQTL